jgi:hypothetical protein
MLEDHLMRGNYLKHYMEVQKKEHGVLVALLPVSLLSLSATIIVIGHV